MNESALSYWRSTGYNREELVSLCSRIDKTHLAALVDFLPGGGRSVTVTSRVGETDQGHVLSTLRFLNDVWVFAAQDLGVQLLGPILLWLEDGVWEGDYEYTRVAPFLCFGRCNDDHYPLLIPDAAFIESRGYFSERQEIDHAEQGHPWQEKRQILYWRGASSGVTRAIPWYDAPRARLVLLSRTSTLPIDARFSLLDVAPPDEAYFALREGGFLSPSVPFVEFLKYRYLIDVDGHHCAWRSLFLKLLSKSAVMKVQSPYCQWYFDRLHPWIHYVPVRDTLEDLGGLLEWALHHDSEMRAIAERGREVVQAITYEDEVRRSALLITELLSFSRPR